MKPKFNFIPYRQLNVPSETQNYSATVSKSGFLQFSRFNIEIYDLAKKWFEFFVDTEKKALGWKLIDKLPELSDLKLYRKLYISPKSGIGCIQIKSLLTKAGFQLPFHSIKLPVQIYKTGYLDSEINYIVIEPIEPIDEILEK